MNTKYSDLINQTYYFPQDEFTLNKDNLKFHNVDLMKLVEEYGTPLKFLYLKFQTTSTRPKLVS
jgi:arginine decarboxylase